MDKQRAAHPRVAIVMGSDSDLPVMAEAEAILLELGVACETTIVSAHRTPGRLVDFGRSAAVLGFQVVIAGAGGAAHLPGMVASLTRLPVIGVPIKGRQLEGLDSLLSIVQMPPGIPVATMAVNGGRNAGLMAARILAVVDQAGGDTTLATALEAYAQGLEAEVLAKATRLEAEGVQEYLKGKA